MQKVRLQNMQFCWRATSSGYRGSYTEYILIKIIRYVSFIIGGITGSNLGPVTACTKDFCCSLQSVKVALIH
jgi:hypothetical protein